MGVDFHGDGGEPVNEPANETEAQDTGAEQKKDEAEGSESPEASTD